MKMLVCVKRVAVLSPAATLPGTEERPAEEIRAWALNEADTYAVEAAVQLRGSLDDGTEVVAVTAGPDDVEVILRQCIAAGADRAIRVPSLDPDDPLATAMALAQIAQQELPQLIICGVQSADAANAATGAALAGYLDQPMVSAVVALEVDAERGNVQVIRELEGGVRERAEIDLPAIISVQTGIYPTRHPNLKAVKMSRTATIEQVPPPVTVASAARVQRVYLPAHGHRAKMLGNDAPEIAAAILNLLREQTP